MKTWKTSVHWTATQLVTICAKKMSCYSSISVCILFYVCLSSLLLPYFMTLWKQTASTQCIRSYTNFVTRPLPLSFSPHSYIWMSEPSTTCTAAVPTSLHSTSLLTEKKKKKRFLPGRPIAWKCHMSTMTSGHFCHRDTVKIGNTVTSCISVALVSITFLHSQVVTYSVFLWCKDQSGHIIPTRRNKAKGFCGAPVAHSSSFITPSLGAVRLQIAASDQSHHIPLGWGCLFSCLSSLTLSLSITCWMIPCAGTEKKEGGGKVGGCWLEEQAGSTQKLVSFPLHPCS